MRPLNKLSINGVCPVYNYTFFNVSPAVVFIKEIFIHFFHKPFSREKAIYGGKLLFPTYLTSLISKDKRNRSQR